MKLVPRSQWGARPPKYRNTAQLNDESTCHWNGNKVTVGGQTAWDHSKCAGLVRGVQNFHMDGRGWSDIAYNFVECPHGYTFEGRGLNVINGANGTNVGNRTSHAIMCVSGEGNPFTDDEKLGFREAVKYVADKTAAPDRCKSHRDWKATACPGDARYNWVRSGMPTTAIPAPPNPSTKKGISMEAALILVKIHYDNARGDGRGSYDVTKGDPKGWRDWVTALLDAQDKGQALKPITDYLAALLANEAK